MIDRTLTAPPPVAWAAQLMMTQARPATTVEAAAAPSAARNDRRPHDPVQPMMARPPDPDRPTGPPPTFDANVLEAERDRMRRPAASGSADPAGLEQAYGAAAAMAGTGTVNKAL